jgi:hypothetical protein
LPLLVRARRGSGWRVWLGGQPVMLFGLSLDASPAVGGVGEWVAVGSESTRADHPVLVRTVREPHTDFEVRASGVDESDDSWSKVQVRRRDVVDEQVVSATQRVPLKAEHHERGSQAGMGIASTRRRPRSGSPAGAGRPT